MHLDVSRPQEYFVNIKVIFIFYTVMGDDNTINIVFLQNIMEALAFLIGA